MQSNEQCSHCGKQLAKSKEIHAVEGALYCSKDCAIEAQTEIIIHSARGAAEEWYNDGAEIVTPEDIGIVKFMTPNDIYTAIKDLAKSQGYYGRLLATLNSLEDHERKSVLERYASHNLKDTVDLILFLEG